MFVLRARARHEKIAFPVTSHPSELSTDESLLQRRPDGQRLSVKQQFAGLCARKISLNSGITYTEHNSSRLGEHIREMNAKVLTREFNSVLIPVRLFDVLARIIFTKKVAKIEF